MSPLDQELRAALTTRAVQLTPAVDPLAGIEARAGQLRRRRLAGQLAGTALAVALVAVAVPAAIGSTAGVVPPGPSLAAPGVAPAPSATSVPADPFTLDPAQPWALRGDADLVDDAALQALVAAGRGDGWAVSPLWAETDEASGRAQIAYLAVRDDEARWGVAEDAGERGLRQLADLPVPAATKALVAALPGDGQPRLLVLAAPRAVDVLYSPSGEPDTYRPITPADPQQQGVGLVVLGSADLRRDRVQVLAQVGDASQVVAELPVPDPVRAPQPSEPPAPPATSAAPVAPLTASPAATTTPPTTTAPPSPSPAPTLVPPITPARPENLLGWPARGQAPSAADLASAGAAYAAASGRGGEADDVELEVLYAAELEGGLRVLVGQAWFPGEPARSLGWAAPTEAGEVVQISPPTEPGTAVLALLVTGLPGRSTDELVVVPQPGTGQVEYGENDATEFRAEGRVVDGVWHIERDPQATTDQLRVLDGDGDLDDPTYQGPVRLLLCGLDSCS